MYFRKRSRSDKVLLIQSFSTSSDTTCEVLMKQIFFSLSSNLEFPTIGDSGNTGDGGKIVGGAIGAYGRGIGNLLLVALYACMTFIYGSSWKGEMASKAKRYLDKSSEGSGEVFPNEAGK
ncbi:hypothetical protein Tco_0451203 [Tanacetum coccineum]